MILSVPPPVSFPFSPQPFKPLVGGSYGRNFIFPNLL